MTISEYKQNCREFLAEAPVGRFVKGARIAMLALFQGGFAESQLQYSDLATKAANDDFQFWFGRAPGEDRTRVATFGSTPGKTAYILEPIEVFDRNLVREFCGRTA